MKKTKKLRLYCILSGENLFHPAYLRGILKFSQIEGFEIVGITIPQEKYRKGFLYAVRQQISLWGFLGFMYIACLSVVRSMFSKLGVVHTWSIENIAKKYNIPVSHARNVNESSHIDFLMTKKIDIIISSNGQIFKNELLHLPKIACLNRHSGLLPSYGGVLPVFWAMKNQEVNFGVSVHEMVEQIDQGDVFAQTIIPMSTKNSMFKNYKIAFHVSIDATKTGISNILNKKVIKKYKKTKNGYFSFPENIDIKHFHKNCKSIVLSDIIEYIRGI